ncbi:hypothetical protein EDC96DRAFT_208911 [Choanephora cucurbitarum]|nr:hypothetical protein EDC96DRAFT_208911 [Choanephora cucurbitarum]
MQEGDSVSQKKRRRPVDLDGSDIVYLLKEMLNAVFSDTLMRWKSGEKTSDATKRSKKANSTAADSQKTVIKNLMGRRSDLIAYNQKKVPVCLREVKVGCSSTESTRQESKSIRCTKSLQLYNAVINGSNSIWSLDMNGQEGYLYYLTKRDVVLPGKRLSVPLVKQDIASLEVTIKALYELKNCIKQYNEKLTSSYRLESNIDQVYHTSRQ